MEVGVIIGAGIGVGSTTLAGWLASRRDDRIRREERTDARRSELGLAMRNYLLPSLPSPQNSQMTVRPSNRQR
jgi:hypothetical protein